MTIVEMLADLAQPLIVVALTGVAGVFATTGKRIREASRTADRALELAEETSTVVKGLADSVDRLNESLHSIDILHTRLLHAVGELEKDVQGLRDHKHEHSNKLQAHETRITLLERNRS